MPPHQQKVRKQRKKMNKIQTLTQNLLWNDRKKLVFCFLFSTDHLIKSSLRVRALCSLSCSPRPRIVFFKIIHKLANKKSREPEKTLLELDMFISNILCDRQFYFFFLYNIILLYAKTVTWNLVNQWEYRVYVTIETKTETLLNVHIYIYTTLCAEGGTLWRDNILR